MSEARAAVRKFIEDFWGKTRPLSDDEDLFDATDIWGDEAAEFMAAFVARFEVDASGYLWYFHHDEEGGSIGALFHTPITRRFGRIPITIAILTEAVRTRRWPVVYPEHELPRRRWDIVIEQIISGTLLLLAVAVGGWIWFAGQSGP